MHGYGDTGTNLDMEDEKKRGKKGKREQKSDPFWLDGHIFAAFGLT